VWLLGVRPDPVGCALLAGARLDRPSAEDACQGPADAEAPVVVSWSRALGGTGVLAQGGSRAPCTFRRVNLSMTDRRTVETDQLMYSYKLYLIWLSRINKESRDG
jgi:hypothetical protein